MLFVPFTDLRVCFSFKKTIPQQVPDFFTLEPEKMRGETNKHKRKFHICEHAKRR